MRHNLAATLCVGAALLPLSAGWADGTKTPAPATASPPVSPAAPAPSAATEPAAQASASLPAPPARSEAAKAAPVPHVPRPLAPAPASAPQAAAAASPGTHHANAPKALISRHANAPKAPARPHAFTFPTAYALFAATQPHAAAPPAKPASATSQPPAAILARPVAPPAFVLSHPVTASAKPARAAAPAVRALPDYGGRDSIAGTSDAAPSVPALNPLAQAWRAFEALAIVLALVVGGLYGLKRLGLLKPDGSVSAPTPLLAALPGFLKGTKPVPTAAAAASPTGVPDGSWMSVIGSQALPNAHGAALHLVSLGGKTLLLGTTAQSVTLISELEGSAPGEPAPTMDTGHAPFSFDSVLSQASYAPVRQANETELLMNATTMRLQAMIARSEGQASGQRS